MVISKTLIIMYIVIVHCDVRCALLCVQIYYEVYTIGVSLSQYIR